MPTSEYHRRYPSFPTGIPTAPIPTISFRRLQDGDDGESESLYEACRQYGIFLLDLGVSDEGGQILKDAEKMFDLGEATLNIEKEVLDKYAAKPPRDLLGCVISHCFLSAVIIPGKSPDNHLIITLLPSRYKSAGLNKTDDGKPDNIEFYSLGQDDTIGTVTSRRHLDIVENQRHECQDFFRHAHTAVTVVLSQLERGLGLAPGTLAALSPLEKPSDTSLRLIQSRPHESSSGAFENGNHASVGNGGNTSEQHISLGGHTDIGIITVLFYIVGGLQVIPFGADNHQFNWRYVQPLPNHVLINIGDTMVEWTGGLLRSPLHRVVTPPGLQATVPRLSLAYLVRPARDTSMQRLKSRNAGITGDIIPDLSDGETGELRSTSDWAAWRVEQIMKGELKPQASGGRMAASRGAEASMN